MLVGVVGLFFSPAPALIGLFRVEDTQFAMGLLYASGIMVAISFGIYLIGHGLAWWYHG